MKVLYVIDSLGAGGAERSTAALIPELTRAGLEIHVVTLYRANEGSEEEVRETGVPVVVLAQRRPLGEIVALRRIITAERPDIVHTALFRSDITGRLAAIGTGAAVISSLTDVPRPFRVELDRVPRWKRWLVDRADVVTARFWAARLHAVTAGVARLYAESYPSLRSKISVVERGRDASVLGERTPARRAEARERLGLSADAPVLLAVGRHEHQKAHVMLVHAVAELVHNLPNITLLIAGRAGGATVEVEHEIVRHGLNDHVQLLGHRSDVGELLAAADVFVQSSLHEGAAGSVLEAMAISMPIVSTDVEGLEGVLEHDRNCVLVPVDDPDRMAAGVTRVLADPGLGERLGAAAGADFESRFTLEMSVDRMIELYRSVLES